MKVRRNFYPVVVSGGDVRVYTCEQQLQYSTSLSKPLSQSASSSVTPASKESSVFLPSQASASYGKLLAFSLVLLMTSGGSEDFCSPRLGVSLAVRSKVFQYSTQLPAE